MILKSLCAEIAEPSVTDHYLRNYYCSLVMHSVSPSFYIYYAYYRIVHFRHNITYYYTSTPLPLSAIKSEELHYFIRFPNLQRTHML